MINMISALIIAIIILVNKIVANDNNLCDISGKCQLIKTFQKGKIDKYKALSCLVESKSPIEFNHANKTIDDICKIHLGKYLHVYFKPSNYYSRLHKNDVNFKSFREFTTLKDVIFASIVFDAFRGFDIELFSTLTNKSDNLNRVSHVHTITCLDCIFEFYKDDKKVENGTYRSIFQVFSLLKPTSVNLVLSDFKHKISPLAFDNLNLSTLTINGKNSFYSRRTLTFTNGSFPRLNSNIKRLKININDVDINLELINPWVFQHLSVLYIENEANSIHRDLFTRLKDLYAIYFKPEYFRPLIHKSGGIEWMKSINKDLNVNLSDLSLKGNYQPKYIFLDCDDFDTFPNEDVCVYRDFPFNQLVFLIQTCKSEEELTSKGLKLTCTFLYLAQYYKSLINKTMIRFESEAFKSMNLFGKLYDSESCDFESRLKLCNKSNFEYDKSISLSIDDQMQLTKTLLLISSYCFSFVGIVTNIISIIAILRQKAKGDLNDRNHCNYLTIYSLINCLFCFIYLSKWLSKCEIPYQVFCPQSRKSIISQYFKIILHEVVLVALQLMTSLVYIAISLNRISLITADYNSKISMRIYLIVSLLFSVGFSLIRIFKYRVNYGQPVYSYPIDYDYQFVDIDLVYFVIDSILDLFNFFILVIIQLSIDVRLVMKLKETLRSMRKFNEKDKEEVILLEDKSCFNRAVFLVVFNTAMNLLLKLPSCIHSFIVLLYHVYKRNDSTLSRHRSFARFYTRFCVDGYFCDLIVQLVDFLYILCISIPISFFIYKSIKRIKLMAEQNNYRFDFNY